MKYTHAVVQFFQSRNEILERKWWVVHKTEFGKWLWDMNQGSCAGTHIGGCKYLPATKLLLILLFQLKHLYVVIYSSSFHIGVFCKYELGEKLMKIGYFEIFYKIYRIVSNNLNVSKDTHMKTATRTGIISVIMKSNIFGRSVCSTQLVSSGRLDLNLIYVFETLHLFSWKYDYTFRNNFERLFNNLPKLWLYHLNINFQQT